MSSEETLEIGVITKPHGIRGEVKVKLHFEGSDALDVASKVQLVHPDGKRSWHGIEHARPAGKGSLLALEGVTTCNDAETLRGVTVHVLRSELPPLGEGEYYLADLVGCTVYSGGSPFGVVREVRPDPSIDTLVIETPSGELVEQPVGDAWVGPVDVANKRVELLNEDGLIR
jgi:16S rRNA processing protein RimM